YKYIRSKVKASAREYISTTGSGNRDGESVETKALLICPYYRDLWKVTGTSLKTLTPTEEVRGEDSVAGARKTRA
ncbi:hypothetical protein BGZ73_008477, partial [Actinomortierella ambigua]